MERRRSLPDVLAGGIFVLIGGAFVVGSLGYELGTPLRMGPGYFPLLVGAILAALGLAVVVKGLIAGEVISFGAVPWRAVAVIVRRARVLRVRRPAASDSYRRRR